MHDVPALQDLQIRILRALGKAWGAERCFGYESRESQQRVIDGARGDGWEPLALERQDNTFFEGYAMRVRDDEAVSTIAAWRQAHPEGRMALVYGEFHVDGHIFDRLPAPAAAVVVLVPAPGLVRALGQNPDPRGRVFQAVGRDVFYWSVGGWTGDEADLDRLCRSMK